MEESPAIYRTHNNYDRPYKVAVTAWTVTAYARTTGRGWNDPDVTYEEEPCFTATSDQILIGKSPQTRATLFSGGHGPKFDGNSILLRLDNSYVFIGANIIQFTPRALITEFVSPVGNNDVPYPYAVDALGNFYLLIENVIVERYRTRGDRVGDEDPYDYYYRTHLLASVEGAPRPSPNPPFRAIRLFWVGDEKYMMPYEPYPEKDYDRLVVNDGRLGDAMYLTMVGTRTKRRLSKRRYCALHREFGVRRGYAPLATEVLHSP
jgi:hypothetical protein